MNITVWRGKISLSTVPPSVDGAGKAVKIPRNKLIIQKTLFLSEKNNADRIKFVRNPADKTAILTDFSIESESSIWIPIAFSETLAGASLQKIKIKKWENSWISEKTTTHRAIPIRSVIRKAVSTTKNSGEISTFVLSTEKFSKKKATLSDRYFSRLPEFQNGDDFPLPNRFSPPPLFFYQKEELCGKGHKKVSTWLAISYIFIIFF